MTDPTQWRSGEAQAMSEGREARRRGLDQTACHYGAGSMREAWLAGWESAMDRRAEHKVGRELKSKISTRLKEGA